MKIVFNCGRTAAIALGFAVALAGPALLLSGCGGEQGKGGPAKEEQLYTCGMHPQVIQNKPGNCPICGMKLTPVRKQAGAGQTSGSVQASTATNPHAIQIDPVTVQQMNLRTANVTRGPLRRVVRTVGVIEYNEAGLAEVTTKFKGWVEKLYVDTTGQQVHRGEPLFEIYSPELYSAQREFVLGLEQGTNSPGAIALQASARTKLKFFDISDEQIAELERTREPRKALRVVAPQDGFVVEKMVVEGQMVDAGMKLYRLADLGLVWVQAQIYEQDLDYVKLGQEATVTLSYLPDREFRGRVTYIYPNVEEKTRTARVRMEFHNPGYFLKPGMFATVQVLSELAPSVLLVPDMAVLRSGERNTVFVALEGGKFEPRTVMLGPQAENDLYQVLSGLTEGERIVVSGQFLLDSESQLREAIEKMGAMKPGAPSESQPGNITAVSLTATNAPVAKKIAYICPMPEHVSIEYDHPGKCPLCGMTLVPVSGAALARIHPGGKLLYYTCPMPEHSEVHESKPGKCPRCGMTLIPVMEQPKPLIPSLSPSDGERVPKAGEGSTPSTNKPAANLPKLYTCPMASDADVVSDRPGTCPKCEMPLVPTDSVAHGKTAEANWRKQHPNH